MHPRCPAVEEGAAGGESDRVDNSNISLQQCRSLRLFAVLDFNSPDVMLSGAIAEEQDAAIRRPAEEPVIGLVRSQSVLAASISSEDVNLSLRRVLCGGEVVSDVLRIGREADRSQAVPGPIELLENARGTVRHRNTCYLADPVSCPEYGQDGSTVGKPIRIAPGTRTPEYPRFVGDKVSQREVSSPVPVD